MFVDDAVPLVSLSGIEDIRNTSQHFGPVGKAAEMLHKKMQMGNILKTDDAISIAASE